MELVLIATAAVVAGVLAHANPPRSIGPIDPYTAWLVRRQMPAMHR